MLMYVFFLPIHALQMKKVISPPLPFQSLLFFLSFMSLSLSFSSLRRPSGAESGGVGGVSLSRMSVAGFLLIGLSDIYALFLSQRY